MVRTAEGIASSATVVRTAGKRLAVPARRDHLDRRTAAADDLVVADHQVAGTGRLEPPELGATRTAAIQPCEIVLPLTSQGVPSSVESHGFDDSVSWFMCFRRRLATAAGVSFALATLRRRSSRSTLTPRFGFALLQVLSSVQSSPSSNV